MEGTLLIALLEDFTCMATAGRSPKIAEVLVCGLRNEIIAFFVVEHGPAKIAK